MYVYCILYIHYYNTVLYTYLYVVYSFMKQSFLTLNYVLIVLIVPFLNPSEFVRYISIGKTLCVPAEYIILYTYIYSR